MRYSLLIIATVMRNIKAGIGSRAYAAISFSGKGTYALSNVIL